MRARLFVALLLSSVLLLALTAYWPGLHGGFLFDDWGNLPVLNATGPVDTWPTFWRYVTSGTADPTGRPLTLLSFLLDARSWPADPYPFKRTNLTIHLFNGLLLYALLARLGRMLQIEQRRYRIAALVGTALWLLHPLLVSTTLYIVQREAMLPATCVMAGLLIWLHGRTQLANGKIGPGLGWSALGLGGFTLLGILAKANGALLPAYALLIEIIVLTAREPLPIGPARRIHRGVLCVLGVVPVLAIFSYLVWTGWQGLLAGSPPFRSWTYAQRLLTEPRVLMDYLTLLWIPRPFSTGLFNDHYVVSTSLLRPVSTLPAMLVLAGLIGGAWHIRKNHPALALAVLFYFTGQLIESTTLPLELYYEHRNYVPALLMFWPLSLWLADTRTLPAVKYGLMIILPVGLAAMTHASAKVWGDVQSQALIWAQINPDSARAQTNAAQIEMQNGRPQDAVERLDRVLAAQPDQVQLAFNLIGARCMTGGVDANDIAKARATIQVTSNIGALFAHWFDNTLPAALSGSCPGLGPKDMLDLINAGLQNPKLAAAGSQQDFTYLRGRIELAQHEPALALADFQHALDLQVRPGLALEAAATLGAAGYPAQGVRMLDHYQQVKDRAAPPGFGMPMVHEWVLTQQQYWPREQARLRRELSLDAAGGRANTARSTPSASMSR